MTTTVTIAADDFTTAGRTPAGSADFRFTPVKVNFDSAADRVLSAREFFLTLDSNGTGTAVIPDAVAGNGLWITSSLRQWIPLVVAGYPAGTISLPDLVNSYSVDPTTLIPSTAPAAWYTQLAALQAEVDAIQLGAAGDLGREIVQASPAATWILTVPAGISRRPHVTIFSQSGEEVEADIVASTTTVTVTFPAPFAGTAVLN